MNNIEMIEDIFERTKAITRSIIPGVENPQMTSIMNYLLATSVYIKDPNEVEKFKEKWEDIKVKIVNGINPELFYHYSSSIYSNLDYIIKGEKRDNSKWLISPGISYFYSGIFLKMYGEAKIKHDNFNKNFGDKRREHYEHIFSTKENFEEALRRGDPSAFCE